MPRSLPNLTLFLAVVLSAPLSWAQEESSARPSHIALGLDVDSSDFKIWSAEAQLALHRKFSVFGFYSSLRSGSNANEQPSSSAWQAGLALDLSPNFSSALWWDWWGQDQNLTAQGGVLQLTYLNDQIDVSLHGGLKRIDAITPTRTGAADFQQWGFGVSLLVFFPWTVRLAHTRYSYEVNLEFLATANAQRFFPVSFLSLAANFLTYQSSLTLSYALERSWWEFEVSEAKDAINLLVSHGLVLSWNWSFHPRWSWRFTLGQSDLEEGEDSQQIGTQLSWLF